MQVSSNEGPHPFPREIIVKIHWQNLIIFFYITNGPINFNQTCNWHKAFLGEGDSNLFKWRATPFSKGDNSQNVKLFWKYWKIFFFRTTSLISSKLCTKHPWLKGIQVCWLKGIQVYSNEEPRLFPRGDNYEMAKIHEWNKKIFFSRTTGSISNKLGKKAFLGEGDSSLFEWKVTPFSKGEI